MGASTHGRGVPDAFGDPSPAGRRPRIVVAEDDSEMRDLIASALHKEGYEVTGVEDGARLVVWVVSRRPDLPADLIISDLPVPVSSGLQILRGLRDASSLTPFILMTAFGDEGTRAEAESMGAILFEKPFEIDALRVALRHLLSEVRARV